MSGVADFCGQLMSRLADLDPKPLGYIERDTWYEVRDGTMVSRLIISEEFGGSIDYRHQFLSRRYNLVPLDRRSALTMPKSFLVVVSADCHHCGDCYYRGFSSRHGDRPILVAKHRGG